MNAKIRKSLATLLATAGLSGAVMVMAAPAADAAYYDSRYRCVATGSLGSWRAFGYDNRGNHDYTGPKRILKSSATNDCINWLSVT